MISPFTAPEYIKSATVNDNGTVRHLSNLLNVPVANNPRQVFEPWWK
jgi:hypothetical protein